MPGRQVFWNIVYGPIIYLLMFIPLFFASFGLYQRVRLWRWGKPEVRWDRWEVRLWGVMVELSGHRRFLQDPFPGVMHFIIFWGAIALLIGTTLLAIHEHVIPFLEGSVYLGYSLILDVLGFLLLIGVGVAAYRRYIQRPDRLDKNWDYPLTLGIIALLIVTGYLLEGLRMLATELVQHPDWTWWSPVGLVVALGFKALDMGENEADLLHRGLWWF
ncbi:MAG TPA: iron-sulfur-binding reductase, partial [Dehalococcoidia bacterium]|nr:iron-sulfur-binding reductase [Dehalococcoidia bacterium]